MANAHLGIVYIVHLFFYLWLLSPFFVFLFNATVRYKTCCNAMLFLGNPDPLSLVSCSIGLQFIQQDNLLAWCELFTNLYELKSSI